MGLPNNSSACEQHRRSHLLVVEDGADSRALLDKALRTLGYSVRVASMAADAVRLAEAEKFDLLLSDIDLPDTDGYELMADLRDRFAMPGIALTGFSGSDATNRCRKAGFSEHIVKPVDLTQLDNAIRRVLALPSSPVPT